MDLPELKTLTTVDVPLLRQYLDRWPRQNCDYAVVNLLVWGKIYDNQFTLWRDHLVLYSPKHAYLFFPVGPGLASSDLRELLDAFRTTDPHKTHPHPGKLA